MLVSAGIGINGYFAFGLGRTLLASAGFAAISVACSIGAFYIPSACRLRPAVAAAWLALFGLGLFEAYGFVASNITDTAADHVNAEVALAERRADTLSASREAECRKRGPLCRDLEAAERAALAALATARERNGKPRSNDRPMVSPFRPVRIRAPENKTLTRGYVSDPLNAEKC